MNSQSQAMRENLDRSHARSRQIEKTREQSQELADDSQSFALKARKIKQKAESSWF